MQETVSDLNLALRPPVDRLSAMADKHKFAHIF